MNMCNNFGCWHHWVEKVMMVLVWVAGVLFFWTSVKMTSVWGYESLYFAWVVVVLSLMSLSMKGHPWCKWMMGKKHEHHDHKVETTMCSHDMGCKCGDCPRCA